MNVLVKKTTCFYELFYRFSFDKNNKKEKFQSETFETEKAFSSFFHLKSFKNLSKPSKFKNESLNNDKSIKYHFPIRKKKTSTYHAKSSDLKLRMMKKERKKITISSATNWIREKRWKTLLLNLI